ncbi:MAG: hypothetical protein PVH19_12450 [Planctomycetia bacterium]|jgi:hypothetical protein
MDNTSKLIFWRFLIWGLFGLLLEVVFMAATELIQNHDVRLQGATSLWMILVYGLIGLLYPPIKSVLEKLKFQRFLRAGIYMGLIFLVEYLAGRIFLSFGLQLWNYDQLLEGNHLLLYAILWYLLGYSLEWLYPKFDRIANNL